MPSLGADMQAGILSEWCKKPGDPVKSGDIIAVVETDKGAIEVEVYSTGTMERILVAEGEKVPVGTVLALIEEGRSAAPTPPAAAPPPPIVQDLAASRPIVQAPAPPPVVQAPAAPPPPSSVPAPAEPTSAPLSSPPQIHASPAARHRARELEIDLAGVTGSGRHGDIVRGDVDLAAAATIHPGPTAPPTAAPAPGPTPAPPDAAPPTTPQSPGTPTASIRRAIASAMARSNREIPHYYLSLGIDLRQALAWLGARNAARPVEGRVLPAALLLHAVAHTLPQFPELNGTWSDDAFHPAPTVNLGVAIALRSGGLVNPCIHDAASLDLDATMSGLADLVSRARAGRLRASELGEGTITVTNLGDLGVDETYGVIYPPQVALVGFGRIAPQPVAVDDMLAVHPVVRMTLAADHRASDGHRGGMFLSAVARFLQEIA